MGKLTLNKHYSTPSQCISNFDAIYGKSEVIVCNDIDQPGIYIYTTGASGNKAINVMDMSVIKLKANPSTATTGEVVSGDTLENIVSKLQNKINAASGVSSGITEKVENIIIGVGLNPDGTYKAITGKYVSTATTVADAITLLSNAIENEKADAIAQGKTYTDTKVQEEIEKLDAEAKAPLGGVFTAITETDGKISADTQMLAVELNPAMTTSNHYDFYLSGGTSRHKWGEIDVPKDQFLKDVSFIASATSSDITTAHDRGCIIELGKAYLVFNFTTSAGDKWVYTDMTSLVRGLTAKDIKISTAYTKTSYNIKAGTPTEDAINEITEELDKLNEKASAITITSTGKTINITTGTTGTNVDVYIDNESIVTNEKAQSGQEGRLSTYINIKRDIEGAKEATASTRMTYHLVKSGGTYYGGGSETYMTTDIVIPRHFITPDEATGPGKWVKVGTSAETAIGRYVVDTTKIGLAVQENIKNALGETEAMGNGLTTAWAVREFMKEGIDGDDVMVGWADHLPGSLLSYYGNIADGHILGPVAKANNVHEAVWKVNNNFDRVADSIGLVNLNFTASTYVDDVYKYDSANTQAYRYISGATTVMGAIKKLDDNIATEWGDFANKSIRTRQTGCEAIGKGSFAEGSGTTAEGATSHSEGYLTKAQGAQSHAEGNTTIASGVDSHAEGNNTKAQGNASHSEGYFTTATGNGSHAEGSATTASAVYAHAEGQGTTASKGSAHAEGLNSVADGIAAHAEGTSTEASKDNAHAEGQLTKAKEVYSHAEGYSTNALSAATHAEGYQTSANGLAAHAEGKSTTATGDTAHAEGLSTTASAAQAHAEGNTTTASGVDSHAEGNNTKAQGAASHSEGTTTTAVTANAHAEGLTSKASGNASHAEGNTTTASGDNAHAEGHFTVASGIDSHAEGNATTASTTNAHAEGQSTQANATAAHAEGGLSVAGGIASHAEGSATTASGVASHAEGTSTVASTANSHTEGLGTKVSNTEEHASGKYNATEAGQIFSIGIGTSDAARKNAMCFSTSGTVKGETILTTKEQLSAQTTTGKLVDAKAVNDLFNYQRGWSAITLSAGNTIKADNNGDTITISGNTYVDVVGTDDPEKIQITTDVADTKAALTAATANNQLAGAYGVREWIQSLDKTGVTTTGQFLRYVTEADGVVAEVKGYIKDTDVKISAVTPSSTNVKEEFALFNGNNVELGNRIKIYKDSAFVRAYIGTMGDTINNDTGVVTPGTGSESLNIIHLDVNGKYQMVKIDLETFVIETEFKDGLKVSGHNVYVTVDTNSEKDDEGKHFLQVLSGGVEVRGINNQIARRINELNASVSSNDQGVAVTVAETNGKLSGIAVAVTTLDTDTAITSAATSVVSGKGVRAAIDALDSTATTTSNAYALTSVTITNGKISAKGETNKIASASTAASADTLDGKHATDLLTEFTNTSTGTNGESRITVGGTSKTCKVNADTVDGYHFVVGSTGTTANTIYFL